MLAQLGFVVVSTLPAGRSVSAMVTSDDGDVRAYVVATLGWLVVLEAARGEDALRYVDEYESIWSLMWWCRAWTAAKFDRQHTRLFCENCGARQALPLSSRRTLYWELRDTGHVMEASANDQVTALSPVKSFRQIVFLMLDAFALFQQGPKIKKCAGYEI
jgi:hypothetical protein